MVQVFLVGSSVTISSDGLFSILLICKLSQFDLVLFYQAVLSSNKDKGLVKKELSKDCKDLKADNNDKFLLGLFLDDMGRDTLSVFFKITCRRL